MLRRVIDKQLVAPQSSQQQCAHDAARGAVVHHVTQGQVGRLADEGVGLGSFEEQRAAVPSTSPSMALWRWTYMSPRVAMAAMHTAERRLVTWRRAVKVDISLTLSRSILFDISSC